MKDLFGKGSLGYWIDFKQNKLSEEKILMLKKIEFIWDTREKVVDKSLSIYHIKNLIISNNLPTKDVCNELSLSKTRASAYCTNESNIPQKHVQKIANYFNIEPHLLQPQKGDGCVK